MYLHTKRYNTIANADDTHDWTNNTVTSTQSHSQQDTRTDASDMLSWETVAILPSNGITASDSAIQAASECECDAYESFVLFSD